MRHGLAVVRVEVGLAVAAPEHAAADGRDGVRAVVRRVVLEDAAVAAEDGPARAVDPAVGHADAVAGEVEEERALGVLVAVDVAVDDLRAEAVADDDAVAAHGVARQEVAGLVVAPLVGDELHAQAPEGDVVRGRAAPGVHLPGTPDLRVRHDAVAVLSGRDEQVVDAERVRAFDEVRGRVHRVGPADLREGALLALQQHVRRDHERAREHEAPGRHEHRAAAVRRRGRHRGVERVGVGGVVVRLRAEVLHIEAVVLPHGARRGHLPRAGVVPAAPASQPVADLHGVASGRHVGRHARVEAPDVGLFKRELAVAEQHAWRARRRLAVGRERAAENAEGAAGRGRIARVALQPPRRRGVERERRGFPRVAHHAPFHDPLGVGGEREHEARIGEHRGRASLSPVRHDARILAPRAAVHKHVVARADGIGRPCHDRKIGTGAKGCEPNHEICHVP